MMPPGDVAQSVPCAISHPPPSIAESSTSPTTTPRLRSKRVQYGVIYCRHGMYWKKHEPRHTLSARQGGLELLRHAEEKRAFNPKYQHAFRHIFFTNGIAPELQFAFRRDQPNLGNFFHS